MTTAGAVKCWGDTSSGKLKGGTKTSRTIPVDVSGLASGVVSVSAGAFHTCAVTDTGELKCWGLNSSGQLGNGTITDETTPVGVTGLTSGVASVSAGDFHTCAVTTTGGLKCWGHNGSGRLGNGTSTDQIIPVDVSGLASGVSSVLSGGFHTCAVTTAGALNCWGHNGYGQIGDGTTADKTTPVNVLFGATANLPSASWWGLLIVAGVLGVAMLWRRRADSLRV